MMACRQIFFVTISSRSTTKPYRSRKRAGMTEVNKEADQNGFTRFESPERYF